MAPLPCSDRTGFGGTLPLPNARSRRLAFDPEEPKQRRQAKPRLGLKLLY